jgi:6-phosphogluconolactonase
MHLNMYPDEDTVAAKAAAFIADEARASVRARGRFTLAVSGGRTPWIMLRSLAREDMPWDRLELFQVDERVAPTGHTDRNLTHLHESLLIHVSSALRAEQVHVMPVSVADLHAGAGAYAQTLQEFAGTPPVLDLVHLGLGPDGHTASLVPGDPVLAVTDADVAVTGVYQQRRRMTMTFPMLNRARRILWVVTGSEKAPMLERVRAGDESIPAGRIRRDRAVVLADRAAAGTKGGL